MRGIVIYYSQAGSTKKIAEAIQRGMSQRLEKCDIVRLKEVKPDDLVNYDLIGLGSPGWHSRPSPNVVAFIESLSSQKGKLK